MKARPILFSAPMIKALLAGTKNQTRRTIKPQPECGFVVGAPGSPACPYGATGDLLWVRETWARNAHQVSDTRMDTSLVYRADGESRALDNGCELPWRPSIFMPRQHSRLTLRITEVRVQRLQAISEADARAEGVLFVPGHGDITIEELRADPGYSSYLNCKQGYSMFWESINGTDSWAANQWVWCLSFEVLQQNVDEVLR